ncbi:DUF362 domain-containing protein [Natranaerobius thermophilus]|uniref:4Fe-4S ferredoxin-type domain-containing protein n=1 Tax=Natranaerobius thermophilus (strain ATCC BAA-1301 / DSM 18059 / JW/NM-WN-LF) TaxID=457570 RepID=B2A581_NATTJ|nr:DUF362 domain-containing protein [Natranaerobius thermophilus]ACB83915.1 protein of unknown function DUF362 [Natranaerobius thermophilus JW/NM-WN-LF]
MENKLVKVGIERCLDYKHEQLKSTVIKTLNYFGGLEKLVNQGDKVLLKVNLLSPKEPEQAVTTHPQLVKVICELVKELGANPIVGDSSGGMTSKGSRTNRAFQISGIQQAAEEAGAEIVNFDEAGSVEMTSQVQGNTYQFYVAQPVIEADVIINLPKLKTHGLTYFTGAVKNMYGVLPGNQKRDLHRKYPDTDEFSRLLSVLYDTVKPDLTIMDGIWSMEGNGPSAGTRKDLGLILASKDGVALDEVACNIIGFRPLQVKTTRMAQALEFGTADLGQISLPDNISKYRVDNFQLPDTRFVEMVPSWLTRAVINQLRTVPQIDSNSCAHCGICQKSCPVDAIKTQRSTNGDKNLYTITPDNCIECYCCHELCPEKAVNIEFRGKLGKLINRLQFFMNFI